MTEDILQLTQDDIWGLLTNEPGLLYVPVFRSRTPLEKDSTGEPIVGQSAMIEEQIEQALGGLSEKNGKSGIVSIVMMPDAQPVGDSGDALEITIIVRIIEDRLINEGSSGTGITASQLMLHLKQVLGRRALRGSYTITHAQRAAMEEISLPDDRKAHELRMVLTRSLDRLAKVARPSVTIDTGVMTITCATEGAELWWSANGDWPGPANAQSWLYELPVSLTEEITEVRVVGYEPTMQPSDDVIKEVG
jgi:hypothetical protein